MYTFLELSVTVLDSDFCNFRSMSARISNFTVSFSVRKLESLGYRVYHLRCPTFSHFDTIPECDRRNTYTKTDRHTHDDCIYRPSIGHLSSFYHATAW